MLITRHLWRGSTLVELMIGITIMGILLALALPSFTTWLQSGQIRSAAEALQNGISLARTEAVNRNSTVRFQFTSTLDATCTLANSGTNWIVSLDDPEGLCNVAPSDVTTPRTIQARSGGEGTPNAVVASTQSAIVFNGLGRVTPVPAGNIVINVTNTKGGTCAASGGNMRCLNVEVTPGGNVRMCDPKFAATDPQGCR